MDFAKSIPRYDSPPVICSQSGSLRSVKRPDPIPVSQKLNHIAAIQKLTEA